MKLLIFASLLLVGLALGHEVYTYYTPSAYGFYPGLTYARSSSAILPLAYSRLVTPAVAAQSSSHLYHSVETPNSFQQQYRSDYKPLTYEYLY